MKIKLLKALGRRQVGEIINMDSASARNLVEKKQIATYVDESGNPVDEAPPPVETTAPPRRGEVITHQVVDADDPNAKDTEAAEGTEGDPASDVADGTEVWSGGADGGDADTDVADPVTQ